MIKGIGLNMVISDRADRSDPGGLMEYAKHTMRQRTSIYNVGTDKGLGSNRYCMQVCIDRHI